MKLPSITAALGALLAVAACSSSGGKSGGHSPSTPTASSSASASGRSADATTKTAVAKAYTTFFNSNSSAAASEAALQHGSAFRAVLAAESNSTYAQKTSVDVTSVRLVSASVADVGYTLHTSGITLPSKGKAVREDGTWKVAAQTFCALLALESKKPKPCSDPAVTSLP